MEKESKGSVTLHKDSVTTKVVLCQSRVLRTLFYITQPLTIVSTQHIIVTLFHSHAQAIDPVLSRLLSRSVRRLGAAAQPLIFKQNLERVEFSHLPAPRSTARAQSCRALQCLLGVPRSCGRHGPLRMLGRCKCEEINMSKSILMI